MNWEKYYSMQAELDSYIIDNHDLKERNVFNEKYLAFLVELGELANETRCFKYWSTKKPSEKEIILAEYVDGIHFLLSIGLERGYRYHGTENVEREIDKTNQFNSVFTAAAIFKQNPTSELYENLFQEYIVLGQVLDLTEEEINQAYLKKNELNYQRQDTGY